MTEIKNFEGMGKVQLVREATELLRETGDLKNENSNLTSQIQNQSTEVEEARKVQLRLKRSEDDTVSMVRRVAILSTSRNRWVAATMFLATVVFIQIFNQIFL